MYDLLQYTDADDDDDDDDDDDCMHNFSCSSISSSVKHYENQRTHHLSYLVKANLYCFSGTTHWASYTSKFIYSIPISL